MNTNLLQNQTWDQQTKYLRSKRNLRKIWFWGSLKLLLYLQQGRLRWSICDLPSTSRYTTIQAAKLMMVSKYSLQKIVKKLSSHRVKNLRKVTLPTIKTSLEILIGIPKTSTKIRATPTHSWIPRQVVVPHSPSHHPTRTRGRTLT